MLNNFPKQSCNSCVMPPEWLTASVSLVLSWAASLVINIRLSCLHAQLSHVTAYPYHPTATLWLPFSTKKGKWLTYLCFLLTYYRIKYVLNVCLPDKEEIPWKVAHHLVWFDLKMLVLKLSCVLVAFLFYTILHAEPMFTRKAATGITGDIFLSMVNARKDLWHLVITSLHISLKNLIAPCTHIMYCRKVVCSLSIDRSVSHCSANWHSKRLVAMLAEFTLQLREEPCQNHLQTLTHIYIIISLAAVETDAFYLGNWFHTLKPHWVHGTNYQQYL